VLGMIVLAAGCGRPVRSPPGTRASDLVEPREAQPKLATIKLWIGPKEITVEQAVTEEQVQTGLMFRKEMAPEEGMLFIFEEPHRPAFWMHNTLLPLSCAYLDHSGVIV